MFPHDVPFHYASQVKNSLDLQPRVRINHIKSGKCFGKVGEKEMWSSYTVTWRKRYANNVKTSEHALNTLCLFKSTNISCLLIHASLWVRKFRVRKDE